MQIAELVPEVAFLQSFAVGKLEVPATCERLEHREVARARLMQAGEHSAHGADWALWRDKQVGPAFAGVRGAVLVCNCLERAHGRGPDRDDAPACCAGRVDQARGLR